MLTPTMATATIGLRSRRFPTEATIQTANLPPSRRAKKRRVISPAAIIISLLALLPTILWLWVATHDGPPPTIPRERPVMTAFMEDPSTINLEMKPLPPRTSAKQQLIEKQYSKVTTCGTLFETFPIDEYPETDPYLPWIHDVFPDSNGTFVHFVAQNRRRCQTGKGWRK
ncbi:glycosyltransferase [Fragilaria crotonensis]|nr:glycosyltransferase [Fragilaria crotonensis]